MYLPATMRTPTRPSLLCAAFCVAIVFVVSCAEDKSIVPSSGAGSIVVSSMNVERGQQGVVIPVMMTNDVDLRGIVMPLMIRQIDAGAFVTSLKLSFGDRLPVDGLLKDIKFTNQYFSMDGACKDGTPGGFGTIAASDTLAHNVPGSPVGVLFSRQRLIADNLPIGADQTGSFLMTVDVATTAGRFEIDTTCVNPSNHLLFVKPDVTSLIPSFSKGEITIK